jgi:hypothetical protein
VFCDYCRSRIVVSGSDAPVPLPDVDRPYFSIQSMGRTASYDVGRFTWSLITVPLLIGSLTLIFIFGTLGWTFAVTFLIWLAAYFSIVYLALVYYNMRRRPIDLGGSGVSPLPTRSEAELIESDHLKKERSQ